MSGELEHIDETDLPGGPEPGPQTSNDYYGCPACGQAVDRRHLDEVLHHAQEGHKPLVLH